MSLTIKQAFEALSASCSAGMKNPFFVMRRLKESFADVASKVADASGDKVTVTQTLTEGTAIGSIKVNNDTTVLYAPAASSTGHVYSTDKVQVGTWTDGKPVYEKTYTGIGRVNSGSYSHFDSSIKNFTVGWIQSLSISGVNATKPASSIHGLVPDIQFTQSVGMALDNNTGYDINVFAVTIRWVEHTT